MTRIGVPPSRLLPVQIAGHDSRNPIRGRKESGIRNYLPRYAGAV